MFYPDTYFDFDHTDHHHLLETKEPVWTILSKIADYLSLTLQPANHGIGYGTFFLGEQVFIGANTIIEEGAMIKGPAWIGEGCQLRKGCYIRENVIVGNRSIIGNSCELKNAFLFDEVQIPHFNYVGDSILGFRTHLGAGAILSNVRLDRREIVVRTEKEKILTGLRKFGAILGDYVEIGCNALLSPGSILGKESCIYPMVSWSGVLPSRSVVRKKDQLEIKTRSDL